MVQSPSLLCNPPPPLTSPRTATPTSHNGENAFAFKYTLWQMNGANHSSHLHHYHLKNRQHDDSASHLIQHQYPRHRLFPSFVASQTKVGPTVRHHLCGTHSKTAGNCSVNQLGYGATGSSSPSPPPAQRPRARPRHLPRAEISVIFTVSFYRFFGQVFCLADLVVSFAIPRDVVPCFPPDLSLRPNVPLPVISGTRGTLK